MSKRHAIHQPWLGTVTPETEARHVGAGTDESLSCSNPTTRPAYVALSYITFPSLDGHTDMAIRTPKSVALRGPTEASKPPWQRQAPLRP